MKLSSKMLYFWNMKTQFLFCFSFKESLGFLQPWSMHDDIGIRQGHPFLQIQSCSIWKMATFGSVSLDNFIKHNPLISEEWMTNDQHSIYDVGGFWWHTFYERDESKISSDYNCMVSGFRGLITTHSWDWFGEMKGPKLYPSYSFHVLTSHKGYYWSLFRNKRCMLDKMFQWNASKFAILSFSASLCLP